MNRSYCAVLTQSHVYLVVPVSWLENKNNKITKVFYSPNQNDKADFKSPVKYFVNKQEKAVYNAYIIRYMRKYNQIVAKLSI